MKTTRILFYLLTFTLFFTACDDDRDLENLEDATFPAIGEVFIDDFSPGLEFSAFGGSDFGAFEVVSDITYEGEQAIRISVPDSLDPSGAFAGGELFTSGRDLSGFNVLTFWARASRSANVGEIGFGKEVEGTRVVFNEMPVNTNWQQYYLPIPDPSKLTAVQSLTFFSEGAESAEGYTIWMDEIQFENLGTVAYGRGRIVGGKDSVILSSIGGSFDVSGGTYVANIPTGVDQEVGISSAYFDFTSSNPAVATVDANGKVNVISSGTATITASLAGEQADGSLTINVVAPTTLAPVPPQDPADVISIFSNSYPNEPVDFFNGFWLFSTTQSQFPKIGEDDLIFYTALNFVGIQFSGDKTIDASGMSHFHMDIWTPEPTAGRQFKILLVDAGADNSIGTGDDSSQELTFTSPKLQTDNWVSFDIPFSDFSGLTNRSNLAQIVLSGSVPNVFVDNIYFYNGGGVGPNEPEMPAPVPTLPQANVISLFSDAYTDVPVDTWRTSWSMATFEDVLVDGNPTKKYSALEFVGIETVMNQIDATNMTHFHIDVWTPNAGELLIKLVDFGADGAFDGGDDTEGELSFPGIAQGEWVSFDLPLADFAGLTNRLNMAQIVLSGRPAGSPTVFVDNVYFYN